VQERDDRSEPGRRILWYMSALVVDIKFLDISIPKAIFDLNPSSCLVFLEEPLGRGLKGLETSIERARIYDVDRGI
jgi:hypothetical protein